MKTISTSILLKSLSASVILISMTACDNNSTSEYSILITNLTHSQPLSPPVAIIHEKNFKLWSIGEQASYALELMAEGGNGSDLTTLHSESSQYLGTSPLFPGETIEFNLNPEDTDLTHLSIAGMLVNTNDAFSGLNSVELEHLKSGQSIVYYSHIYDAGTELNSELVGTIPGPSDGGEGFNPARDDVTSVVTFHGGLVTADDNYSLSTLSVADKFDNPALRIVITNVKNSNEK